jgi:hypothetical protein
MQASPRQVGVDALTDGVDAFLAAALLNQCPAAQRHRVSGLKREIMLVRETDCSVLGAQFASGCQR